MKNLQSISKNRFLTIRQAFVFSIMMAFGTLMINVISGCSAGPSDSQPPGMVTTTIYGRIFDEAGKAMQGVSVAAGTQSSLTDANGIFILKNATVPAGRAVVIAKKAGYFNGARAEAPGTSGVTRMEMSMMTNTTTASISSLSGGTVNVAGGATIDFAAGSFTDASGVAYSGAVKISARYLDPKNTSYFDYFSGDDMAQTASGKSVSLISSGVLRVELKDPSGAMLKLDASKPATLNYPKPIDTKAPTVMPLWYFDESLGMWKEEGSATLKGGVYTGTVSHFTDWNLDYFDSTGQFGAYGDVTLHVTCNGLPVSGVAVSIVGDDAPGKYFVHPGGKTGPDGVLHFIRFPANRPTQVDIRSDRNAGLFFINTPLNVSITPGQSLDLGEVILNSPCPASIKGSLVGCDDAKAEGLVTISDGVNLSYIYTKSGDFAAQAATAIALNVDAMDVNGNQATTVNVPALASGELRDIGNIKVCGSATANYIDITVPAKSENSVIAFSPDGSRIAISNSYPTSQVTVYDTKTGNLLSTAVESIYPNTLQFSTDNMKLLISNNGGGTLLFDVSAATATQIVSIPKAMRGKLYDDGSKIIGVESMGYPNPPVVNIYSATDGSVIKTLHPAAASNDSTLTYGFIRDEDALIFPDDKTTTDRVWSIATDAEIRNFAVTGQSYAFAASEDGLTIGSSVDYQTYSFFDAKTGNKINDIKTGGPNGTRYGNQCLTKNNAYTTDMVSGANVIRIFKIATGTSTVKLLSGSNYVSSIAASRNEQYLAAASNGTLRIWKLQ